MSGVDGANSSSTGETAAGVATLRDVNNAFRLLVDTTTDYAIFLLDPQGHVRTWNAGAQRLKGYRADEIVGQHFSIFYPPDALERNWPAKELELAALEGRFEDEGWRVRKDGRWFWANVVITALRDEIGNLVGFGKVSRDLTERKRAEEQLRESEERFRLIIDSTVDYGIFMLDPEGRIESWNEGAQRIKGYTADEIIGRHFSIFYTPEALASGWPAHELKEAARVGRFEDEGLRVRKDGSRFWANVIIAALRGADGVLRGYSKVTRDISERKAHEDRIERLAGELRQRVADLDAANSELAQKNAENESFVYSVSHDLRSPLVNLQGFSQELMLTSSDLKTMLADAAVPPPIRDKGIALVDGELRESINFIGKAVAHLSNIIDGLLRLSRVGRVEYQFAPVDLTEVVTDIVRAMHSTVSRSGAQVTVHHLPVVLADRNAAGQVFANIIGNALKSLDAGRRGTVDISATEDDPPVFAIRDNGVGIPEEYRSKIFRVFQHVHTTRTRGEGMGLAIVWRIIERHGGRIWFESTAGEGTTFFFTLGGRVHAHSASS